MSLESENIQLREINAALILAIKSLEARVLELEEKLKMTSKNSSKPPSSDRFKPNLRAKNEKNEGDSKVIKAVIYLYRNIRMKSSICKQTKIREQAQAILDQAKAQHPPPEPPLPGHRGRVRG